MGAADLSAPASARALFGPALAAAEQYARLLAGPGIRQGVVGRNEAARLWDRHILNCGALADLVPRPCSVVDLGSGAGLPGVVLALLLPDVQVTLLERMSRRAAFLERCVRSLGLENATVVCARAEEVAGHVAADVVAARAVAPLGPLAGLAVGLLRPGGVVLAMKGEGAEREVAAAAPELARLGLRDVTVVRAGGGRVVPAATVVRLTGAV